MLKHVFQLLTLFALLLLSSSLEAKKIPVKRVDPANWFVGLPNPNLELIIHAEGVGNSKASLSYGGLSIVKTESPENQDYLYLTLKIEKTCKPGKFDVNLVNGKNKYSFTYELKPRRKAGTYAQGVTNKDLIYLIMPDRFANGDYSNDINKTSNEPSINRDSMYWRHGGDLSGIENHLDYLQELGVTSLWLNPVQENDQPKTSYHGYAITDHYLIDPRLGSNEEYTKLVNALHAKRMKMVMDIVPNHMGNEHYLFKNMPSKDWVNQWDSFTKTTYRAPTQLDPYVSAKDLKRFSDGWFDHHMPDLNQRNPHVANYLTQSYIWWVETAGIDDFRIDTYAYPDQAYMSQLGRDLKEAFPQMNMFGEIWEHGVGVQSFFSEGFASRDDMNSHLPSVIDFQLHYAINDALTKSFGWTDGVARIYYTLAKDILYKDAMRNVTFLDNHDLSRFYSVVGEDIRKFKMGISMLLTMRGIPSVYYGTEILMTGYSNPDGLVRSDFLGGWKEDEVDKFTPAGRNEKENEAVEYFSKLANWRLTSEAATGGKMMQFIPEKSMYVYFRYTDSEKVMIILNAADEKQTLDLNRFTEMVSEGNAGKDVLSGKTITLGKSMDLEPWSVQVIEFK